uniref:Uncharacterized protein n=1 Tax=Panagrolaimus sp. JU765 TaxID=591449 RepID=A0AC34QBV8_9BILA
GDKIFNNKNPEAFKDLVKDLVNVAEKNLHGSRSLMSEISKELRPALLASGFKTDFLIKMLRKNKFNLFQERIQKPHPIASWQLWWRKTRHVF